MENLKALLEKKRFTVSKVRSNRKPNPLYNSAKEFSDYLEVPVLIVLRMIKKYGEAKVFGLRSWAKDCPRDERGLVGLLWWKLKNEKDKKILS